jgi:integrase
VVGMHEQEARRSEATINVILTAVTMFYEYHARIGTVEEISLLYETGMRVGQALGLRHADIHSWDNVL